MLSQVKYNVEVKLWPGIYPPLTRLYQTFQLSWKITRTLDELESHFHKELCGDGTAVQYCTRGGLK